MKLLLAVNPISGGINKEPFLKKAEELLDLYGINYQIFKTTGKNDNEELKKIVDQFEPDKIAALGGDGTFLFVALNLLGTNYKVGVIPFGSANGMAKELGVSQNQLEALKDIIMSDLTEGLDLLRINDQHYSLHIGDVGVNANIVQSYEKDPNRGMSTYAKYFVQEVQRKDFFEVEIEANGQKIQASALMVAICNGRKYGTGVPLNVISNPMDGLFEIMVMKNLGTADLVKAGLSVFDEKFYNHAGNEILQTDNATIRFTKPRLLQLDGEVVDNYAELRITLEKAAINFITTRRNQYLIN